MISSRIQAYNKLFLSGPFGSGKTHLGVERIRWLLRQERIRGDDILVLVPQRTFAQPYYNAARGADMPPGPPVRMTTFAGLVRQTVELYWPILVESASQDEEMRFADAKREPTFLNLETNQYHMAQFVHAAIDKSAFDGIRIKANRVVSQVLDNLNKAALHGFSIDEAYERLELAVPSGEHRTAQLNALRAARQISKDFRQLCQKETLLDFSMQVELFNRYVVHNPWSRTHLFRSHRHLIFDNLEEDNASTHVLVREWLPSLDSALLLSDLDAGYRVFLGADPRGADMLSAVCEQRLVLDGSHVMSSTVRKLTGRIRVAVRGRRREEEGAKTQPKASVESAAESAVESTTESPLMIPNVAFRFYPQMVEWVVKEIHRLINDDGVAPGQIAILAPFVSDSLRFSIQTGLNELGIVSTTHRPSRALQAEPTARCLLTLAALAHPHWNVRPAPADVTLALTLSIEAMDPVRAHLLSRIAYPPRRSTIELGRFGELVTDMQQRITYAVGEAYDHLRDWIYAYRANPDLVPLDQFFARLFGEILSQPSYGFHQDYDAARVANQLVGSARNFRWALEGGGRGAAQPQHDEGGYRADFGSDYLRLIESDALGALHVAGWKEIEDAVFLAPAYTFLMRNRAVDVQFWIDIGSSGWWERLYQPLTHPHVLSKRWPVNQPWSDFDEFKVRQDTMERLLLGLVRRTRQRIYLGISDYSESGFEQQGPLLMLINKLLAQYRDIGK